MRSSRQIDLILGTAQLVTSYGVTRKTDKANTDHEAAKFLSSASAMGFRILDTAPAYGHAEQVIGLTPIKFSVHTKLRSELSAQDSLRVSKVNLNTEEIDVMYVHDLGTFRKNSSEMMNEISELLDLGVKKIGVSIYDRDDWNLVKKFKNVTVIQVPMNILDQRFSGEMLEEFQSAGVSCIVRSAFLQGVLLANHDELRLEVKHLAPYLERFTELTSRANLDPLTACLGWLAGQTGISGIIVGTQTENELQSIMKVWEGLCLIETDLSWSDDIDLPSWEMIDPRNWAK
jgi:uncharacterized protein